MRKSTHSEDPVTWWNGNCYSNLLNCGKQLRTAFNGKALILNKNTAELMVLEILPNGGKGKEITVINSSTSRIFSHEIFSKEQDKVACITSQGSIYVYKIFLDEGTYQKICQFQLDLISSRSEVGYKISICPESRHIAVILSTGSKGSRIMVLKFVEESLVLKHQLDLLNRKLSNLYFGEFLGYRMDNLIYCALVTNTSKTGCSKVLTFVYNETDNEMKEISSLRRSVDMVFLYKLVKLGECFYCIGDKNHQGNLLKINYA